MSPLLPASCGPHVSLGRKRTWRAEPSSVSLALMWLRFPVDRCIYLGHPFLIQCSGSPVLDKCQPLGQDIEFAFIPWTKYLSAQWQSPGDLVKRGSGACCRAMLSWSAHGHFPGLPAPRAAKGLTAEHIRILGPGTLLHLVLFFVGPCTVLWPSSVCLFTPTHSVLFIEQLPI